MRFTVHGFRDLLAHSANELGETQPLELHAKAVAVRAAAFAAKFGAENLGYAAGLLHDLGKASGRFQSYIRGIGDSGGDHKAAGARRAVEAGLSSAVPFAIAGHHGGMPDLATMKSLLQPTLDEDAETVDVPALELPPAQSCAPPVTCVSSTTELELFTRMLFSALVDADYLDTERHLRGDLSRVRGGYVSLAELRQKFLGEYARRFGGQTSSPLAAIRTEVFDRCVDAAQGGPGAYSLTVPTGGGKTLAGMAFALEHAVKWGLDRVVVVIPYTSIIEQTVDVYREFLGREAVVEHHSAAASQGDDSDSPHRLATENWDAPLIVTTAVQFFESLFANKPSKCRKLHSLARSVVIIDEAQTLPMGLLEPTFEMLTSLVSNYFVTCLLTTATQPAYGAFTELAIQEIMPDPPSLARQLRRVHFERCTSPASWEEIAGVMTGADQAMAVVNTRADARALFAALPREARVHLSTNLCGAHRRSVLARVRGQLLRGERCLLATTQLVEAGVDIDFPVVLRAMGPLEAIVQAAGRCNREGRLKSGRVVLFEPQNGGVPRGSYETATMRTRAFLDTLSDVAIDDPAIHQRYFRQVYTAVNLDAKHISKLRSRLDFPAVAAAYRVIEDETVPVAVSWGEGGKLLEEIGRAPFVTRDHWRRVQPYLVNMRRWEFARAQQAGLCGEAVPTSGLWRWEGRYDEDTGLEWAFDTLIL